jgi:hypothetical protein
MNHSTNSLHMHDVVSFFFLHWVSPEMHVASAERSPFPDVPFQPFKTPTIPLSTICTHTDPATAESHSALKQDRRNPI